MTTLPHFQAPFSLGSNGKPIVVQQDSPEDIASCVSNIVVCPQGAKLDDPTFGVQVPLFGTFPTNFGPVLSAVQNLEPRASVTALSQALDQSTPGQVDAQLLMQALVQAEVP